MNNVPTTIPDQQHNYHTTFPSPFLFKDNLKTTPTMTPYQNDSWPWLNSPIPYTASPHEFEFDFNSPDFTYGSVPTAGASENQFDPSLPGSELTTPVVDLAASPDVDVLSDESIHQLSATELELQQLVKDYPDTFSPLSAFSDLSQDFVLPQQPLMVSPMEFSGDYLSNCPSLFAPITDEEIALMSNFAGYSMPMSGTVPNNISGTVHDVGMALPMPSSTVSGSESGLELEPVQPPNSRQPLQQLPLPPVLPSMPLMPSMPSPTSVSSVCAPSPANLASPHTFSPPTIDGDHSDASGAASGAASGQACHICSEPGCGKVFLTGSRLRKHVQHHVKPFVCHKCSKASGSKKDLNRHMWTYHRVEAERQGVPTPNRACPAPGCSYTGRDDNVTRHINAKHPEFAASTRASTGSPGGD